MIGIESGWPGFELFSTSATKGDVVESDSKFIEHVALKLMPICVDCEHRLKPNRCSKIILVDDRNRRQPEEALVPLDAPLKIRNCQGVMIESWKRRHPLALYIPESHARVRGSGKVDDQTHLVRCYLDIPSVRVPREGGQPRDAPAGGRLEQRPLSRPSKGAWPWLPLRRVTP